MCVLLTLGAYVAYPFLVSRGTFETAGTDHAPVGVVTGAVTGLLSMMIAAQGFGYLHDARKVNMYHSLPITVKRRFSHIYLGGLLIFGVALMFAQACGLACAVPNGRTGGDYYPLKLLMGLVITVLYFLCIYHFTIFAFSITGHSLMGILVAAVLITYVDLWQRVYLTSLHFDAYSQFFSGKHADISIVDLYFHNIVLITDRGSNLYLSFIAFCKSGALLLIWCLITFVMARRTYVGRPAESSEKLIAFYSSHMLIKLMIVVPVALLMGEATRESFYLMPDLMQVISMILTAYVVSFVIEFVFEQSASKAFRAIGSYVFALVAIFGVFGAFRLWEARFDGYVPEGDELESFAVFNPLNSYYYYFNIEFDDNGRILRYVDAPEYAKNEMILTDVDAVLRLAHKGLETDYHDMKSPLPLQVYYRLKGSAPRMRQIWVDMDDEENRTFLNRIMGPAYYKIGIWQCMTEDVPEGAEVYEVRYVDSDTRAAIVLGTDEQAANDMIHAWRNAMVMFDYDHVRYSEVIGEIEVTFMEGAYKWVMPVYPDMMYNIREAAPERAVLAWYWIWVIALIIRKWSSGCVTFIRCTDLARPGSRPLTE